MSETRSSRRPSSPIANLQRELRKRGQAQMQQMMGKMMQNPELMKSAGQAMALLSQVNQARAKGVKPLNEVFADIDRAIDRLDKKVDQMTARLNDLAAKADKLAAKPSGN